VYSQSIEEIKSSGNYYWGEGKSSTLNIADRNALTDLISQISVNVKYSVQMIKQEEDDVYSEYTESITKTYSNATLSRAERKVVEGENEVKVIRFITKKQLDEIFAERKVKIFDYIKSAKQAEADERIGDALKYYYWSLALLNSHPDCNKIKYPLDGSDELVLITALPDKINSMIHKIDYEVIKTEKRENVTDVYVKFMYADKPVQSFEFTYWMGDTWSVQNATKNGIGLIQLTGNDKDLIENVRIRIEYTFFNNSRIDPDVNNVLEMTNIPFFKNAEISLNADENIMEIATENSMYKIFQNAGMLVDVKQYVDKIDKIKNALVIGNISLVSGLCTSEGYKMLQKLSDYGTIKMIPQTTDLVAIKYNNEVYVRAVPMSFSFRKNNRNFVEEVIFVFDDSGKICSISFSLGDNSIKDILNKREEFAGAQEKYQILQFMEDYKSAYCLGRIDYLEQVFADNALIIVGQVLKTDAKPLDDMYLSLGNERIEYLKLTKKEYIERLRLIFNANEYVNIQFDENTVKKADEKLYGIQIAQNYYSATYADKGYLFLMMDLNDANNPKIYVRTWQPEKNPDGSIIGITDFKF
jgi:hypothetical protein